MRKLIIVLLIIALLLPLCACDRGETTTSANVSWCAGKTTESTGWCSDRNDDVSWFQTLLSWPDGE